MGVSGKVWAVTGAAVGGMGVGGTAVATGTRVAVGNVVAVGSIVAGGKGVSVGGTAVAVAVSVGVLVAVAVGTSVGMSVAVAPGVFVAATTVWVATAKAATGVDDDAASCWHAASKTSKQRPQIIVHKVREYKKRCLNISLFLILV
jgi:hypothetical protein